jgi:hypothetical protein
MAETLDEIRARAARHQVDATERTRASVQQLADHWGVSPSTVRDIPFGELPYLEFGRGAKFRRRRYRWEDVEAYERAQLDRKRPRQRRAG